MLYLLVFNCSGQWKVFTGNEIGILFGWWAFTHHKKQHPELYPGMLRSIETNM